MSGRVLLSLLLLVSAGWVVGSSLIQARRGTMLFSPSGLARDVRDVRRRSAAAAIEGTGLLLLAGGLLVRERPLIWLGAVVLTAGALAMSVARRGLARRGLAWRGLVRRR